MLRVPTFPIHHKRCRIQSTSQTLLPKPARQKIAIVSLIYPSIGLTWHWQHPTFPCLCSAEWKHSGQMSSYETLSVMQNKITNKIAFLSLFITFDTTLISKQSKPFCVSITSQRTKHFHPHKPILSNFLFVCEYTKH